MKIVTDADGRRLIQYGDGEASGHAHALPAKSKTASEPKHKDVEVGRTVPIMALKVFVDPWHLVAEEVRAMCDAMREAGGDASRVEIATTRDISRQVIRFDMRSQAPPK